MNIPGYQLGREIGVGEFCSVYSALDLETSKTVTVRVFQPELSSRPEFCQYLKKTAKLLAGKSFGIITPIKQAVPDPAGCYVISEYFPCSKDQEPVLTEFTIDEVLNFGLQLAESLSQLHALGLVHGGVSLTNILVPNFTEITLGPYSIQRTFNNQTDFSSLPISESEVAYIAPEFHSGLTPESDFYSLGVVLFELLFKTKPFNAQSLKQLQLNKEAMQFDIPDAKAECLRPLFEQLLDVNPATRLSSVTDFIKVVRQCGFSLHNTQNKDSAAAHSAQPDSTESRFKMLTIGAVSVVVLVILLTIYLLPDSSTETVKPDKPVQPVKIVEENNDKKITTEKLDSKETANSLYLTSKKQVLKKNYGAALMNINNALKEQPDHSGALKLKAEIELEIEVRAYLSRADDLIQQLKLTQPEKDNAFYTYKQLASILPEGDSRVINGLRKIANVYYQMANDLILKKDFEPAKDYISAGLAVMPDHPNLKQLEQFIAQEEQKLIDEQSRQLIQKKKAQEELRHQQELAEESKRQAALKKEQQIKKQQQEERDRKAQLLKEQQQIDLKIMTANKLLTAEQLTQQSLESALSIHAELIKMPLQDSRTDDLFLKIIDAYAVLAVRLKEIPDLPEALKTVEQGLALDRKNQLLQQIKNDINTLISEAENRETQVPIFGTF